MMEARRIVSNTGPLISLETLHRGYDFIRLLYDTIIIPPGVLNEVAEGQFATPHAYVQHYGIVGLIQVHSVSRRERLPEAARNMLAKSRRSNWHWNWHFRSSLKKRWGAGLLRAWVSPLRGLLGKC